MKKDRKAAQKALELKLARIRTLTAKELDVPAGGLPTNGPGCPTGSGCGCSGTGPE